MEVRLLLPPVVLAILKSVPFVFCCGLSDDQKQGREATSLLLEVGCGGISDEMEGWRGEREVEKGCQPRGGLDDVQLGLM